MPANKTRVIGGGVEVEGLKESIRALSRWDKGARSEAVDVFRDEAKAVQSKAKARARDSAASSSSTSWIGRSATGSGAGVKLIGAKGDSRGWATEWGMHAWHIRPWGKSTTRGYVQTAMRRRTFKPYKGVVFDVKGMSGPGYVIQATLRRHLPGMEERVADKLQALLRRELDKAGVPRG